MSEKGYTGEKDMHGKEIRGGDLLKYPGCDWSKVVFLENGCWIFNSISLKEACGYPIEIIGNIRID